MPQAKASSPWTGLKSMQQAQRPATLLEAASEMIGVWFSETMSSIASVLGVVVLPRIMSLLLSVIGRRALATGAAVLLASSNTSFYLVAGQAARHQLDGVLLGDTQRDCRAGGRQGVADVDVGLGRNRQRLNRDRPQGVLRFHEGISRGIDRPVGHKK